MSEASTRTWYLTITTYASWLPGDARGWRDVKLGRARPAAPKLESHARKRAGPARFLTDSERITIARAIESYCRLKGWRLYALNVRTNHVHAIVDSPFNDVTTALRLKGAATLALREVGLATASEKIWTEGTGSERLGDARAIARKACYALEKQGVNLPGAVCGELWRGRRIEAGEGGAAGIGG